MVSEAMVRSIRQKRCGTMDPMDELGEATHKCRSTLNTCAEVWFDDMDKLLGGIMKKHHGSE